MQDRDIGGLTQRERDRKRRLFKAKTNLFWLATEILGFDLLTEEFHKPILDEWDERRRQRHLGKYRKNELELWPRYYFKTTCRKAQAIQDFLWNPMEEVIWWHAVEDRAEEEGQDIGKIIQSNEELRKILPDGTAPARNSKKFVTAKGFRLPCKYTGAPSFRMFGSGSEATGGHGNIAYLDDIIGLKTIEDSEMPRIRRWFGTTVMNVVKPGGPIRVTGTHWDLDDVYMDWRKSRSWDTSIRACFETENRPDWNGQAILLPKRDIEFKRRNMSDYEFSCQMMNDPLPESERIWTDDCEHYIEIEDARSGKGRIFILSDDAPAGIGSDSGLGERQRKDGSKDYWSIAVVRIRVNGDRLERVLLDGVRSQEWTTSDGLSKAAKFMLHWGTNLFFTEAFRHDYTQDMLSECRRSGTTLYLDGHKLPRFKDSYGSGARKNRVEALCSYARRGEFLICKSVPESFLHGDKEHTGFLTQMRKCRWLASGRNNLRFDDDADAVSRCTDSRLLEFAPRPMARQEELPGWSPYRDNRPQPPRWGTRHIRFF